MKPSWPGNPPRPPVLTTDEWLAYMRTKELDDLRELAEARRRRVNWLAGALAATWAWMVFLEAVRLWERTR